MELSAKDLETLKKKGISEAKLNEQLSMLKNGFPFLKIDSAVTPGHGLTVASPDLIHQSEEMWRKYLASGAKVMKMVPASGAASRMFKNLYEFFNGKSDKPDNDFMKRFFENIEKFAFFGRLNFLCLQLFGYSIDTLIKRGRYKDVVDVLLNKIGLNYGKLPKALLEFHKEMGGSRTPLQEHLAEGAQYAAGKDGKVHLHFTVSADHVPLVEAKLEEIKAVMQHEYGVEYDITLSIQKPSTDTVASLMDGTPYRENGEFFFRPGGHGALIENLNDLDADVIFIKNIDNLVPDALRQPTITYKMVLGGILVGVKAKLNQYCESLAKGVPSGEELVEMLDFLHHKLCISHDKTDEMNPEQLREFLFNKFNRPTRICGMVKNQGEPGGGPFLAYNPDGTVSPQILESSQINPNDEEARKLLKEATHFNPVDLVVCIKDYKGHKFNLPDYVDKATGFISIKSREGVEIKALELPGLWNGAMSDWNTVMIEVPVETFNPVKTVNDLLRPTHQPF